MIQKKYEKGPIKVEYFDPAGRFLIQRDFHNGQVEWYDKQGKVIQKKDRNGNITIFQ